jgi:hypothetical protein
MAYSLFPALKSAESATTNNNLKSLNCSGGFSHRTKETSRVAAGAGMPRAVAASIFSPASSSSPHPSSFDSTPNLLANLNKSQQGYFSDCSRRLDWKLITIIFTVQDMERIEELIVQCLPKHGSC